MERIKCTIAYDGAGFAGFQVQPNQRTVQGTVEKALAKIHKGETIRIQASGRTDTGVHAVGQVIHFDTPLTIPERNWKQAVNTLLPDDVRINKVEKVSDAFHARYSVKQKEYHYYVLNREDPDVFRRDYVLHFPRSIDIEAIQAACKHLEGTHDFTTFSSAKSSVKGSKVRTLFHASCEKKGDDMEFIFRGSGFLYNMVRIMVSALLDVGIGKRKPEDIPELLAAKERGKLGKTISPNGLYLWEVSYDEEENDSEE
ncbi:tRNA pseudouridine(38-40) synthase TruA [Oceanobacillus sp. J11TS1]|uniref:tRNA pseudouridine(38-40) synthase TruA n=1 Tax=Oceanobacillus sp. J11TS1 TaxID=2807191 RepID=UPI001B11FE06|nr:tRNA pseudouridine(38-40) synthase TruA [Oceanobacillus sp. J11TS1]GIO22980.1 tRNA pseudouridine synthase A 1 [Oceanobacillus sp. J11TS1]